VQTAVPPPSPDWQWRWWLPVPLYPYGQRRTLQQEVVADWVWSFEQIQGVLYVVTPLRMTIFRLAQGGLLVYAPIAPTPECLRLVDELVAQYGTVQHIILPTISGIEHKVFVGPFARYYSQATVYVAPGQWSFPLNLPLSWLGLPSNRTQVLGDEHPFGHRFDWAILEPIRLGIGQFSEVALFDREFQLLLTTDTIVSIPAEPPPIIQLDPYPLLFHARDRVDEVVIDTPANRRKGWQRIVLFTFYFRPGCLEIDRTLPMIQQALSSAPVKSRQTFFGLYPFHWQAHWPNSFAAIANQGRPLVAPILQQLILNRSPAQTLAWVDQVARWNFQKIISCHLAAPIAANHDDFRQAFAFLTTGRQLPAADFALLEKIDAVLSQTGILPAGK
jgi:Domain of unknown function (DUF4336)